MKLFLAFRAINLGMETSIEDSFILMLVSDVESAIRRREQEDSSASRRDLVRSSFAAIDGFAWVFREEIASAAKDTWGLEPEEEIVLSELSYSVSDQGKIFQRTNFITTTAAIRLTSRIASRINGTDEIDFGSQEWSGFREAIQIRNRITHPKSVNDLVITSKDVDTVLRAFFWLFETITDLMASSVKTRLDYLGKFQEVFDKLKDGDPDVTSLYNALRLHSD